MKFVKLSFEKENQYAIELSEGFYLTEDFSLLRRDSDSNVRDLGCIYAYARHSYPHEAYLEDLSSLINKQDIISYIKTLQDVSYDVSETDFKNQSIFQVAENLEKSIEKHIENDSIISSLDKKIEGLEKQIEDYKKAKDNLRSELHREDAPLQESLDFYLKNKWQGYYEISSYELRQFFLDTMTLKLAELGQCSFGANHFMLGSEKTIGRIDVSSVTRDMPICENSWYNKNGNVLDTAVLVFSNESWKRVPFYNNTESKYGRVPQDKIIKAFGYNSFVYQGILDETDVTKEQKELIGMAFGNDVKDFTDEQKFAFSDIIERVQHFPFKELNTNIPNPDGKYIDDYCKEGLFVCYSDKDDWYRSHKKETLLVETFKTSFDITPINIECDKSSHLTKSYVKEEDIERAIDEIVAEIKVRMETVKDKVNEVFKVDKAKQEVKEIIENKIKEQEAKEVEIEEDDIER